MSFSVERVVPILRIYDRRRAHEFYVDYLGFTVTLRLDERVSASPR